MVKDVKKVAVIGGLGLAGLGIWALTKKAEAIPPDEIPPTQFAYASGIGLSNLVYMGSEYFLLEIDIQNIGQVAGVCTITNYHMLIVEGYTPYWIEYYNGWYVVRSAELAPGEIKTFSGRVETVYRFPQKYKVESEAGVIESPLYPSYWTP
ncbi:hypothetical protein ES703_58787 [subsurface metagenome]